MAYSPTEYTGDNSTTDFAFSWPYIDDDHVICKLDTVATTAFTLPSAGLVRFNTAPGTDVAIEITRDTPDTPIITWSDGAVILGNDLTIAFKQALYLAEEAEVLAEIAATNAAAASAAAAASSEASAEAAWDAFDDTYLGAKASPPTLDNDGDPLAAGMLYYNTGTSTLYVYSGSAWGALPVSNVTSIYGRTGTVVATASDYDASLIDNDSSVTGAFVDDALNTLDTAVSGKAAASHTHGVGDLPKATADQIENKTADYFIESGNLWTAMSFKAPSYSSGSITCDLNTGFNFSVTITQNSTLQNFTNMQVGQSGLVMILQDGTGGRTLAFGSYFRFENGTTPVIGTGPNDAQYLYYTVTSSTVVHITFVEDVS